MPVNQASSQQDREVDDPGGDVAGRMVPPSDGDRAVGAEDVDEGLVGGELPGVGVPGRGGDSGQHDDTDETDRQPAQPAGTALRCLLYTSDAADE